MSDSTLQPNQREFHCPHCNGKIRIPKDLPPTTGPCPHCSGTITSPAIVQELPLAPAYIPAAPAAYSAEAATARETRPLPVNPAEHVDVEPSPVKATPAQVVESKPIERADYAEPQPISIQSEPEKRAPAEPLPARRKVVPEDTKASPLRIILPILTLVTLLLLFAAAAGYFVYKEFSEQNKPKEKTVATEKSAAADVQYTRLGWQRDAYSVLEKFLAAKTVEEKLPYIIDSKNLKAQMESFYGGSVINDMDTPADAFSVNELSEFDHNRGIFMMVFDQPPQFDIKDFFRPLANLEVQYGLDEADILLSTLARVGNFATEPVRVNAFFKRTPEGLKLDWETFAQTKYRTFQTLVELPEAGQSGVFRVIIAEDVPDAGKPLPAGVKTYRITDPASPEFTARVNVNLDSDLGKSLAVINWRGQENRPINRTATLELKWSAGDKPELQISRFICWEFLHLGGEVQPTEAPAPR